MKIEQIEVNKDNFWELCKRDDLFIVRISKCPRNSVKAFGNPYAIAFSQLSEKVSVAKLLDLINGEKQAVVKVTYDEEE